MLTRHTTKLFGVMEHVLSCGSAVVTANFFLSNRYVARRKPLVRPAHTQADMKRNRANLEGTVRRHREALQSMVLG